MLKLDGAQGEGGGQILRSALALSILTDTAFRLERIRAGRSRPGLQRQHLTAVKAAAEICGAVTVGAELNSQELTFRPRAVQAGEYTFDIGTAGSCLLVLQTILPPLLLAPGPSQISLRGGTHNPFAPPFDFLDEAFIPLINRMGPQVTLELKRYGFFPAGGGKLQVNIEPVRKLAPLIVEERGEILRRRCRAIVAGLPRGVAEREAQTVASVLNWPTETCEVIELSSSQGYGPGNAVVATVTSEAVTEVFMTLGSKGVRAEEVARTLALEVQQYLDLSVPVGEHLADQLLLPIALARSGSFVTGPPSSHTDTNIDTIRRFLNSDFRVEPLDGGRWRISLGDAANPVL